MKNIVSLLGTDLQKEKFAAGLMRRKEIISLLFNDIFKEVIEKFEVFENEDKDEYDNVSTKATLSDEQFAKFLEIKKYCSSCSFSFHHAYNDEDDDCLNDDCLDYVKIVNQIGYLTLECRVKL